MNKKVLLFACNITTFLTISLHAQIIYYETFDIPDLGIWGNGNGIPVINIASINWNLSCTICTFSDENDYAKTVSTSGGRFEVLDCNGEAYWSSPLIDITAYPLVSISLDVGETGSSTSPEKKYVRAALLVDGFYIPFVPDSMVAGNWGNSVLKMDSIKGSLLQIIVVLNSSYSNDKVFIDNVIIKGYAEEIQEKAEPFDLIFNEIMADPTPSVGLPEVEYIELYNPSEKQVSTEGWVLTCRNTSKTLPAKKIKQGSYVILCSPGDTAMLSVFGTVLPVKSFPSLINSGATLILSGHEGTVIDSIHYTENWYHDEVKKKGGWSLERIDPKRSCGQNGNWTASININGGTPGGSNSVLRENRDTTPPFIANIKIRSSDEIDIFFSEALMQNSITAREKIRFTDGLHCDSLAFQTDFCTLVVKLKESIQINRTYNFIIDELSDACGNKAYSVEGNFSHSYVEPGKLLISEVLFNPKPGGSDFVEIYNPGGISFDLSGLSLASRNDSLTIVSVCKITESRVLIEPKSFMSISTVPDVVMSHYDVPFPERLLQTKQLPTYPDTEGTVILLNDSLQVVDEMNYDDSMHNFFINNTEGVSLERTSFSIMSSDKTNWHSSSSLSGYATPGYQNSQTENPATDAASLDLSTKYISPDGDGFNDQLLIKIRTPQPGYLANIIVFDAEGRAIKQLANNLLVNNEDEIIYPGNGNEITTLKSGLYLILAELVFPGQKKAVFKKPFAVIF